MLRIREKLKSYDFSLFWAPGKDMVIADLLSRSFPFAKLQQYDSSLPRQEELGTLASLGAGGSSPQMALFPSWEKSLFCFGEVTSEDWKRAQDGDPQIQKIISHLTSDDDLALSYRISPSGFLEKRCYSRTKGEKFLPVCPVSLRPKVLTLFHSSTQFGGHKGSTKTLSKIRAHTTWPHVTKETTDFVKVCPVCNATKPRNRKTRVPLCPVETALRKFDIVFIDLLGPFPVTPTGNKYLLVAGM